MFNWKEEYLWDFSDEGRSAPDKGPAITGSKMFRGGQYKNVIRETAQNSCDAKDTKLPEDIPVRMRFRYITINREDIPGADRLSHAIDLCYEYMKQLPNAKMDDVEILSAANNKYLKASKIPVLQISDYNTSGLTEIDYQSLMNCEGITFKTDEDTSGSFGFGKFAPYLLSPVNTLLYSSVTENNQFLFQGRTFLSTFKENGIRKQGTSLFGKIHNDRIDPIRDQNDVPSVFRRSEKGTDLFILCFEKSKDWIDQMILSTLENFFFAIHMNKLEVEFEDGDTLVSISKANLPEIMETYNRKYAELYSNEISSFAFNAPKFWKVLNDERTISVVNPDFRNKGEVILYVLTGEDIEDRSVLQMRSSGMRIQEDTNFRRLPPFNGVMIATGAGKEHDDYKGNISKFLREMESPAHNSWLLEDVKKPEIIDEAEKVISDLHNWIRDIVKEQIPKDDGTPIDVFGLNKILPDITETGENTIQEDAIFTFIPLEISPIGIKKRKPSKSKKVKNTRNKKEPKDDPKPRPEPNPNRKKRKIEFLPVKLNSTRTPYIDSTNSFMISFVPTEDYKELLLELAVSGDDSSSFDTDIVKAKSDGRRVLIKDGLISIPDVVKGQRVYCDISIAETGGCALEVTAYAKRKH